MLDFLTSPCTIPMSNFPGSNTPIPEEICTEKKFYPYFKDCISTIDGTNILTYVAKLDCPAYWNWKSQVSQNILAACSMDLRFLYVLPGWEGSAADSSVNEDAWSNDFKIPASRYYLADAGYRSCDALLVPYCGVRYHLKEWGKANMQSKDAKELFNLCHAQLRCRNVIKHIFGILKKWFKVLIVPQEYEIKIQAQLVSTLSVVHNFICVHDPHDLITATMMMRINLRCLGMGVCRGISLLKNV